MTKPADRKMNSHKEPTTQSLYLPWKVALLYDDTSPGAENLDTSATVITRFVTPSSDRLQTLVLPAPGTPVPPRRVAKGKRRTE